jgi:hypothetical protein
LTPSFLQTFLTEENPDLFKWLTGQREAPETVRANLAFRSLKDHVDKTLLHKRNAQAQTHPSKEWKRGWDDGSQRWGAAAEGAAGSGAK